MIGGITMSDRQNDLQRHDRELLYKYFKMSHVWHVQEERAVKFTMAVQGGGLLNVEPGANLLQELKAAALAMTALRLRP